MIKKFIFRYTLVLLLIPLMQFSVFAQDDLMDILGEEVEEEIDYTAYTFKSTHVINGHSIEQMKKQQLDFRINHRFGQLNSGAYELWGLDNAVINFCFDYGVTDWLMIGLRRGTYQKTYDGSLKFRLLRQSKGKRVMPIAVSYYVDMSINTLKITDPNIEDIFSNRVAYAHQLLIARKFNEQISLQITPSFIHRNLVPEGQDNDVYAIGIGGRYKFIRRVAFTFEYFYASNTAANDDLYNSLSIGFDVETGGHVFQLFVTNSKPMVEKGFIAETAGNWADGGVYFGFNISRVFAIGKVKH
ncbi:MAG: hypothetical protein GQ527_13175 [Bacteroidales bacterium]|nr:hypothetical protein [Bacteroidales bacterium]